MLNIVPLKNFPANIYQKFKDYYAEHYAGVEPELKWSEVHLADVMPYEDLLEFRKLFKDVIHIDGMEVYTVKGPKRMASHIDRGRKCAIQLPMDIDVANNYTYAVNTNDYSHLIRTDLKHIRKDVNKVINDVDHYFFNWDPQYYDTYNLEYPILQNVSVPHGGHNITNTTRRFFSLTIKDISYEDAKEIIKQWI